MELFPKNFKGGEASSDICHNNDIFREYQKTFILDINKLNKSITENYLEIISVNFNQMISNCGKSYNRFKD